ncbi:MAG: DUF3267 domain-containing protein [Clostridia bacterium]|nr:DUF3267 domain-containing protein [Clostridia bacterium]
MSRFYEEKLPEGYSQALVVDAADRKTVLFMRRAASLLSAALFCVFFFLFAFPRIREIRAGFSLFKCVVFVLSYYLYIVLHELTHGLVYKLLTKRKLAFGFQPPVAYCGVPDLYLYRITSLLSAAAPFTVFTVFFAVLFFLLNDPFSKSLVLALLALHAAGCTGDLYGAGLLLFKYTDPASLRKDTGPKQIYYTKDPIRPDETKQQEGGK